MTISAPITITPIQITAPVTFGMIGPQGPNAVTSATTSNGTATLSLAGITIAAFTSGHVVTVTTGGAFTTTSRSGIDTRSTFPPASHTHTASEITDFAAAVAATAPQAHTHGNITNAGAIGSTSGLVVTTGTGGILETTSRSGIDSRASFPNADVTAATSAATINTIVKRSSLNGFTINTITLDPYNGSTGALVVNDDSATLVISPQTLTTSQEQRWPNGSGTYGLVLSDTGAIASTDITDFAAAVAATAPQAHTHGNITNAGAIGSTADLAVITGASGVLTTTSRSGIDTRSTFPNDDVTAATHLATRGTLVRRNATNGRILIENLQVATEYGTVTILGNSTTERPELNLFAGALLFSSTCELTGGAGKFSFPSGDPLVSYKLRCAPIVCSGPASAAVMGQDHIVIASHIFSDPTPSEGAWFRVIVRNGTATVGGTAYSTSGTIIERSYHSGAWANRVYNETPVLGANVSLALAIAANGSGGFVTDTGTVTLTNKTLTNPTVTNFTETVVTGGNTGTSQTIALTNGTVQTYTLTGNCTFTMPTATAGKSFTVLLNTGTGGFTATFTGVKWSGNVAPAITATASRRDIVSFIADGSAWYGSIIQNFTP